MKVNACIALETHPQYDNGEGTGAIDNANGAIVTIKPAT